MPLDNRQIRAALQDLEVWHHNVRAAGGGAARGPKPDIRALTNQLFSPENLSTPEGIGFATRLQGIERLGTDRMKEIQDAIQALADKDPRCPTREAVTAQERRIIELAKQPNQGKALTAAAEQMATLQAGRYQVFDEVARQSHASSIAGVSGPSDAARHAQHVVNKALAGKPLPEGYVAPEPSSLKKIPAKAAAAPAMAGAVPGNRTLYRSIDPYHPDTVSPTDTRTAAPVTAPELAPARQQVVIVSGGNGVGKSTYVDNAMANGGIPKDAVVVDIDRIVKENWPDEPSFATLNGAQKRHAQAEYWRIYDEAMADGKHVVVLDAQLNEQHVRDFKIPEKGAVNRPEVHTIAMVGDKETIWERTVARGQEGGAEAGKVVDRATFDTAHNATTGVLDTCVSVSDKTTILDMTDPAKPVTVATIDAQGQVTQHDGARARANGIDFEARGYSVSTPNAAPAPESHAARTPANTQQTHTPTPHDASVPHAPSQLSDINKGGAFANVFNGLAGAATATMRGDLRAAAVELGQAGVGFAADTLEDKGNGKGAGLLNAAAAAIGAGNTAAKTYAQTGDALAAAKDGGKDVAGTAAFAGGFIALKKFMETLGEKAASLFVSPASAGSGAVFGGALAANGAKALGTVMILKDAAETAVGMVSKEQDSLYAMAAEVSTPIKGKAAEVIHDSNGNAVTMNGAQSRVVSDKTFGEGAATAGAPALSNFSYKELAQLVINGPNAMALSDEPNLAKLGLRNFQDPYYIKQQLSANVDKLNAMPDKNEKVGFFESGWFAQTLGFTWATGSDHNYEKSIAVRSGHSAYKQFQNYELQLNQWVEEKTGVKMPHYHPDNQNENDRSSAKSEINTVIAQQQEQAKQDALATAQELAKSSGKAMHDSGLKHDKPQQQGAPEGRVYIGAASPEQYVGGRT
jgi:hypothetical protein